MSVATISLHSFNLESSILGFVVTLMFLKVQISYLIERPPQSGVSHASSSSDGMAVSVHHASRFLGRATLR